MNLNPDDEVFATVLANEVPCRLMLSELIKRGVEINVDPTTLSHKDAQEILIQIMMELKRRERDERI